MKLIKQEMIRSADDICRLGIIDWHRCNGLWGNNPSKPIKIIDTWLSNNVMCTTIESDLTVFPERADWPNWKHVGNGSHEYIGRLYWNMFQDTFGKDGGTLVFADSPDFQGTIASEDGEIHRFYGDIGQVSASAFVVDVLPQMKKGDLWISLPSDQRQIILEFQSNVGEEILDGMVRLLGVR